MSLQAEFIENINKYAISSNLNSSLNVDTEKIIQDTVKNPLYDELVEHVILSEYFFLLFLCLEPLNLEVGDQKGSSELKKTHSRSKGLKTAYLGSTSLIRISH